jgi:hypothetical protein
MSTIANLRISISEMSEERLFDFIRTLRNNRRVSITTIPTRKKSSSKSSTRTVDVNTLLANMSSSDRETLLQILEEKQDDKL